MVDVFYGFFVARQFGIAGGAVAQGSDSQPGV